VAFLPAWASVLPFLAPDPPNGPINATGAPRAATGDITMTFRTLLATAALGLSLGLPALPALADGGQNSVRLEQWGSRNEVGLSQDGARNRLSVMQEGYGNTTIATQDGARNRTVVGQTGAHNRATTSQAGRCNVLGIAQFGNSNSADVDQAGAATRWASSRRAGTAMSRPASRATAMSR
jgi:hypothetical protein